MNRFVLGASCFVLSAGAGAAVAAVKEGHVTLDKYPVACQSVESVKGRAPSLLPEGKRFKLVWNDEFDGAELDGSKWMYRTNFWGRSAHWFAKPEDGCVVLKDGRAHLKVRKLPNGQFVSPQLQTGEIMWDVPNLEKPDGFWYLGKRCKPKFAHKYGYYECRCRLQQLPGWWSAFWMQTEMQGASLDPGISGIEQDIMESFEPGEVIVSAYHYGGYGPDYKGFRIPDDGNATYDLGKGLNTLDLDKTVEHTFGLLWEPDGYSVYVDGRLRGKSGKAVSHVPEFILISTECKYYRDNRMTGKAAPELEAAAAADDAFVVDYVRVYDIVD